MIELCENCFRPKGANSEPHSTICTTSEVIPAPDCAAARNQWLTARVAELEQPRWHALGADDVLIHEAAPVAMIHSHFFPTEKPRNVLMWSLFPLTPSSWTPAETRMQAKAAAEKAYNLTKLVDNP